MYASGATEEQAQAVRKISEDLKLPLYQIPTHWGLATEIQHYKYWDGYFHLKNKPILIRYRDNKYTLKSLYDPTQIELNDDTDNLLDKIKEFIVANSN